MITMFTMAKVQKEAETIISLARDAGNFKTLLRALEQGELIDTLEGSGPFTVFAPSDSAFKNVPQKKLDSLLEPKNKKRLQAVLKRHVSSGRKMAENVLSATSIEMLDGNSLKIQKKGDRVRIGDATITDTDLEAGNGVVHVIDHVLMPE